jgi:formate transporter
VYFTLVASDATLGFALQRVLGGICFSLGLILVIVAGAELFTGNNLIAMAWADGKLSTTEVIKNWIIVCIANLAGASGLALLIYYSGHVEMNNHGIALTYVKIAAHKCSLGFWTAFASGVLCNILVCLAVWMASAGRSVGDKVLAIVFPISAFVAAGFEHSIANMYFIMMGILLKGDVSNVPNMDAITWSGYMGNIIPVILGNLLGGSFFVAFVYYVIYRRGRKQPA